MTGKSGGHPAATPLYSGPVPPARGAAPGRPRGGRRAVGPSGLGGAGACAWSKQRYTTRPERRGAIPARGGRAISRGNFRLAAGVRVVCERLCRWLW